MKRLSIRTTIFSALVCVIVFVPLWASEIVNEKEFEKTKKPSNLKQISTPNSSLEVLRAQTKALKEKDDAEPNLKKPKVVAQNTLLNQGDDKKKRKRKKKQQKVKSEIDHTEPVPPGEKSPGSAETLGRPLLKGMQKLDLKDESAPSSSCSPGSAALKPSISLQVSTQVSIPESIALEALRPQIKSLEAKEAKPNLQRPKVEIAQNPLPNQGAVKKKKNRNRKKKQPSEFTSSSQQKVKSEIDHTEPVPPGEKSPGSAETLGRPVLKGMQKLDLKDESTPSSSCSPGSAALKPFTLPQFSTPQSERAVLSLQINAWEEKEPEPNLQKPKVDPTPLPNEGEVKKKRKGKKKQPTAQPVVINIYKNVVEETLKAIDPLIQKVIQEKIEEPQKVRVLLNPKDRWPFFEAFLPHIQKNLYPFTWSMINKGPLDSTNKQSPCVIEITFSSDAKSIERAEKFPYQISEEDRQKVDWKNIHVVAFRAELNPEDFRFNNSIKVRTLELKGAEPEHLQEFDQLLRERLPKDANPYHILCIYFNRMPKELYDKIWNVLLQKVSNANIGDRILGQVVDLQNGFVYLCLDNRNRQLLNLHGKKLSSGKYDGRSVKTAKQETQDFIMRAYETFAEGVMVITGYGNHSNNGQKGVLKEAFPEWMGVEPFPTIIKKHVRLENDGGYKVKFKKIQKLDLTTQSPKNFVRLIKQTISQMVQQKQTRLHISLDPQDVVSKYISEFELIASVYAGLRANKKDLVKSITPISIESTPGEMKIILNKEHPKSPKSFSFENNFGSLSFYGTFQWNGDN